MDGIDKSVYDPNNTGGPSRPDSTIVMYVNCYDLISFS